MRLGNKRGRSEQSEIVDDTGKEHKEVDPTEEILQWAKDRMAAVSDSTPGVMGTAEGAILDSEPSMPASERTPSGSDTAERTKDETTKPQGEAKILVVALAEHATQNGQAHCFDDRERAGRFIATLVTNGLDPSRISVFWGTPVNMNVTYQTVVALGQPEQDAP